MFNSCRLTTDISILTETKWLPANLPRFKNEWESELHAACTDRLHAQAGVAILIRRGLAIDIVDKGTDSQGRVAWILAEIYSKKLLIVGVYGPSSGDDDVFLRDRVFSILDTVMHDHVVLGGDWNVGMDEDLDYWNLLFSEWFCASKMMEHNAAIVYKKGENF